MPNLKWFLRVFFFEKFSLLIDAALNSHITYQIYEYGYIYLLTMLWQEALARCRNIVAQNKITKKDMTAATYHWHSLD